MVKFLKNIIFEFRLRRAIKQANAFNKLTGAKYYVLLYKGKPGVYSKAGLKASIAARKFKKGFKPADIDRIALYKTP
jgi:hypothetical protein